MRTLVIDNYDSFTYNLVHYLGEVNGTDPVVIRNDEPNFRLDDLRGFDNVLISPGPGHPARSGDFGICRKVVRNTRIPLLGVCLGHQGICHLAGGTVAKAPEPRHGRISPVLHEQRELFAGLPSPFSAVRYHSLAVCELPPELAATAWTPDGVIMGLRHRHRPLWGVQFHPESVCSEHGHALLANFADLTRSWQDRTGHRPRRITGAAAERARTASRIRPSALGPRRLEILAERLPGGIPAEVVYDQLFSRSAHAFWLDSGLPGHESSRHSFMGDATGPLARRVHADVGTGKVVIESHDETVTVHAPFLDWLDADLQSMKVRIPDLPFEFALGWVGYLGYELKSQCGGDRVHRAETPDASMIFTDRTIAFDHERDEMYLLALAEGGIDEPSRQWIDKTRQTLGAISAEVAESSIEPPSAKPVRTITLRHDRQRYLELIDRSQEAIQQGETYEVCLTNMITGTGWLDPWNSYRLLRHDSPAPFGALLRFDTYSVLSTSPERFLRVSADGVVESKPIKGTRRRSHRPEEDEWLCRDLATNEKDRAENLMIVDLVRHDLGSCAEIGSVRVDKMFEVESHPLAHQLVSTIRGKLRPTASAVDCVRAAFPGGSMTGAPKIRTMQIIDELEEGPRGVYSGALGYFSLSGAADLSIVIRTLLINADKFSFGVGGAIIALSDPVAEFDETAVKASALLRLANANFPGRQDLAISSKSGCRIG
jgi:para-aminobenzoate synthetase